MVFITDNTTCNVSGTAVEIHSPVSLHIYDEVRIPAPYLTAVLSTALME